MLLLIELCGVTPAPGSANMFMLGTGLIGIGWVGRKRLMGSSMV
ncbi:MAG: PEP-CTERM sorting domain-containing protein [Spirochaetales bacterium]|nr:PEP-CTERM sorting domain-containing protein [Spirochaetales bacterium]